MRNDDCIRAGARPRLRLAALTLAMTAALGGCADSLPHSRLPELAKDPRPVLTPDQQKTVPPEITAKRVSKREEALREIEAKR